MIPPTANSLPALTCISAIQKCIRRGMEREAMEFAVEMIHSSKALCSMVCNRLQVISHEDIDTQTQPHIVPFVYTATEQAREWWEAENPAKTRLAIGNAIRMLCRAKKNREGDHFQAAVGLQSLLNDFVPEFPDFVFDMHTQKGKRMGRGVEHFVTEGAKLVPPPEAKDAYADEAHNLWRQKHGERSGNSDSHNSAGEADDVAFTLDGRNRGQSARSRRR